MPFDAVVVFAKAPAPGRVKTRLGACLGLRRAARLYGLFLTYLSWNLRRLPAGLKLFLATDPPGAGKKILRHFPHSQPAAVFTQKGKDLGARMLNAAREAKRLGARKVLLIGSDCLELSVRHLGEALRLLGRKDLVLGPARDGGFYLLGWKKAEPGCFKGVVWSTRKVFGRAAANAAKGGLSLGRLPALADVDEAADLGRLARRLDPENPATRPLRKLLSGASSTAKIKGDSNNILF